jgi:hypothetical protein
MIGLVEVLGREQDISAVGDERADDIPQLEAAARIQSGGRLVEEQQARAGDEARSEVEAAAHAARVRADEPVGRVSEAHLLDDGGGIAAGIAGGGAEEARHHRHVLAARHGWLHGGRLPREGDAPPDRARIARHVDALDPKRSLVGPDQRCDEIDERRLARAVRTEQGQDLARLHREAEAVESPCLAECLDEVGGLQRRIHL